MSKVLLYCTFHTICSLSLQIMFKKNNSFSDYDRVCFPGECNEYVKCRSGESSSLPWRCCLFCHTWMEKYTGLLCVCVCVCAHVCVRVYVCIQVCVYKTRHTHSFGWFVRFLDCPDNIAQSCAERPKDIQECAWRHAHTITDTQTFLFPLSFLTDINILIAEQATFLCVNSFVLQVCHCMHTNTWTHTHSLMLSCQCYKKTGVFKPSLKMSRSSMTHTRLHTQLVCRSLCTHSV